MKTFFVHLLTHAYLVTYRMVWILILAFVFLAVFGVPAHAQTVGLHLGSHHFPERTGQNNVNPGLYVKFDNGFTMGGYRNTLRRNTFYAGYTVGYGPFDLTLGLASGYQKQRVANDCPRAAYEGCYSESGVTKHKLMPIAAPSVRLFTVYGVSPRLSYLPSIGATSAVLSLSVEKKY